VETKKLQLGELIEKYRFFIGGGLLILILIGSGLLLYRENYQKPTLESRITELESRISQLETEGNKAEETSIQTPTAQAEVQGQVAGVSIQGTAAESTDSSKQTTTQPLSGIININTANLAQLDTLSGIGPVYAQRIIDYRNSHGGFKSIDEIKNIKGIGDKTFDKFKDKITI
jgi:competence protein ComEA